MKFEWRVAGRLKGILIKSICPPKTGGEPMQEIGKYTTIYERQPGSAWGIARDIRNSNNSPFIGR